MNDLNTAEQLADLRTKVRNGETVSDEEYTDVIAALRADRRSAASAKVAKTAKVDEELAKLPTEIGDIFNKPVEGDET